MSKYIFDVWTEIHGTVEVTADSIDKAWDKVRNQMHDVKLTDEHSAREAVLVDVEEE